MYLIIKKDKTSCLKCYTDAAFVAHFFLKSITGAKLTMLKVEIASLSWKQKLNMKSSTEAELLGVDDVSSLIICTKLFLGAQGYKVKKNLISK